MILSKTLGNIRITFTLAKVTKVIGVNSSLSDGKHIIMWDFDDTTLEEVKRQLTWVQSVFCLPEIRVVNTKPGVNFIAYCFKRCDWLEALKVVIYTSGVDKNFIKYSAYREHFTLRVTPKKVFPPQFAAIIKSDFKPDCSYKDLLSWVRYQTLLD